MYKLNKIRAHVKMLEFQELKLTRYLAEESAAPVPREDKIKDINRALKRVTDNIALWKNKLGAFDQANLEPKPDSRPAINDGPDRPLI